MSDQNQVFQVSFYKAIECLLPVGRLDSGERYPRVVLVDIFVLVFLPNQPRFARAAKITPSHNNRCLTCSGLGVIEYSLIF